MVEPMTPELLKQYLKVLRAENVMSGRVVFDGLELAVTFGPEYPSDGADAPPAPLPGGWKAEVSDPDDPDPLGLGPLDAPLPLDDDHDSGVLE